MTSVNGRPVALAGVIVAVLATLLLVSCSEPAQEQDASASPDAVAVSGVLADSTASSGASAPPEVPQESSGSAAAAVEESDVALPRLIDLGADKCVPCKMMAPILEELRETYAGELDVIFIDVWKDRSAGEQYEVRVIPTQIFLAPDGSELFRHQGFLSREDIMAKWSELGYEFGETAGEK